MLSRLRKLVIFIDDDILTIEYDVFLGQKCNEKTTKNIMMCFYVKNVTKTQQKNIMMYF